MHSECEFSPCRIQTLTWSHPCEHQLWFDAEKNVTIWKINSVWWSNCFVSCLFSSVVFFPASCSIWWLSDVSAWLLHTPASQQTRTCWIATPRRSSPVDSWAASVQLGRVWYHGAIPCFARGQPCWLRNFHCSWWGDQHTKCGSSENAYRARLLGHRMHCYILIGWAFKVLKWHSVASTTLSLAELLSKYMD